MYLTYAATDDSNVDDEDFLKAASNCFTLFRNLSDIVMYTGATANVYKIPYEQHVPCVTQFLLQCWPKPKNEIQYLGPNESLIAKVYLPTDKKNILKRFK